MPKWHVQHEQSESNALTDAELKHWADEGRIAPTTMLRLEGKAGTFPAAKVNGLFPQERVAGLFPPTASGSHVNDAKNTTTKQTEQQPSSKSSEGDHTEDDGQHSANRTERRPAPDVTPEADKNAESTADSNSLPQEERTGANDWDLKKTTQTIQANVQATAREAKRQAELKKLQLADLPAADAVLGQQAIAVDYVPDCAKAAAESLEEVERTLDTLANQERPDAPTTWKERANQVATDTKDAVQQQRLKQRRKSLWREIGAAIRQDTVAPSQPELVEARDRGLDIVARMASLQSAEDTKRSSLVKVLFVTAVCLFCLVGSYTTYRFVFGGSSAETQTVADAGTSSNDDETPQHDRASEGTTRQDDTASTTQQRNNVDESRRASPTSTAQTTVAPAPPLPTKVLAPLSAPTIKPDASLPKLVQGTPLPAPPAVPTAGQPETWFGVYYQYPIFIGVEIAWQETGERASKPASTSRSRYRSNVAAQVFEQHATDARVALAGTATFFSLRHPEKRDFVGDGDTYEFAKCEVKGWRDPLLRTFSIQTSKWIDAERPFNSRTLVTFRGAQSKSLEQLGGWAFNNQFFVASSNPEHKDELIKRAVEAQRFHNPTRNSKRTDEVSAAEIEKALQWMDLFEKNVDLQTRERWKMGDHYEKAMTLYVGDEFKQIFGTPFDDLTFNQRDRWWTVLNQCRQGKHGADATKRSRHFTAVNMFKSGSPGWAETTAAVWMHRVYRSWALEQVEAFKKSGPHAKSFDTLQSFETLSDKLQTSYFESERTAFKKMVQPVAEPIADATLRSMTYNDECSSTQLGRLYGCLNASAKQKHAQRFANAHTHRRIRQLQADVKQLASIPDNFHALRKTADWQRDLENDYRPQSNTKAYKTARSYVQKRRARLLKTFQKDVIAQLAAAKTSSEVASLRSSCLASDADKATSAGQAIAQSASKHLQRTQTAEQLAKQRSAREEQLAYFSKQERDWIADDSVRVTVPSIVPPPTAESIRAALCREMGYLPGCKLLRLGKVNYAYPGLGKLASYIVTIDRVELEQVGKIEDDAGFVSYRCKYYVDLDMKASGEINDMLQGSIQGKMLRGLEELGKAESKITLITDDFYLTRTGWRSKTIKQRGVEGMFGR